jgi:hypothetical protein
VSQVAALFAHLGKPVQLQDAAEMSAVTPVTALMAPYYQLLDSVTKWMTTNNVRQEAASVFVGSLFHALSVDALKVQGASCSCRRLWGQDQSPAANKRGPLLHDIRAATLRVQLHQQHLHQHRHHRQLRLSHREPSPRAA